VKAASPRFGVSQKDRPADKWLADTVRWAWRVKVFMHLETELMGKLRESAKSKPSTCLRATSKIYCWPHQPARATMGLDPGLRTGVKVAIVDATGKVMEHADLPASAAQ
jgi:uncharacterized protein